MAWLLGALLAVAVLRLWRLPEAGPPDFDSVRNWQVVQEMGREINTLGSKAGDVAISRAVVEMKAALEKIRELIQNVE